MVKLSVLGIAKSVKIVVTGLRSRIANFIVVIPFVKK